MRSPRMDLSVQALSYHEKRPEKGKEGTHHTTLSIFWTHRVVELFSKRLCLRGGSCSVFFAPRFRLCRRLSFSFGGRLGLVDSLLQRRQLSLSGFGLIGLGMASHEQDMGMTPQMNQGMKRNK